MKYYDVLERNRYIMIVKECEDITELSDTFVTSEQLGDLGHTHYYGSGKQKVFFEAQIRKTLQSWIDLIKPGCNSTRNTTSEILQLIEAVDTWKLNHYLDDLNESGQPLYAVGAGQNPTIRNQTAARAKPRKRSQRIIQRDYKSLIRLMTHGMYTKYDITIEWDLYSYGFQSRVNFAKKVLAWRDITKQVKEKSYFWGFSAGSLTKEDLVYIKQLWDNPELVNSIGE